jgi:hypothetical protein
MNAAKSKSCVITSKSCAKALIGFYVDPRPRTNSTTSAKHDGVDSVASSASSSSAVEEEKEASPANSGES